MKLNVINWEKLQVPFIYSVWVELDEHFLNVLKACSHLFFSFIRYFIVLYLMVKPFHGTGLFLHFLNISENRFVLMFSKRGVERDHRYKMD